MIQHARKQGTRLLTISPTRRRRPRGVGATNSSAFGPSRDRYLAAAVCRDIAHGERACHYGLGCRSRATGELSAKSSWPDRSAELAIGVSGSSWRERAVAWLTSTRSGEPVATLIGWRLQRHDFRCGKRPVHQCTGLAFRADRSLRRRLLLTSPRPPGIWT